MIAYFYLSLFNNISPAIGLIIFLLITQWSLMKDIRWKTLMINPHGVYEGYFNLATPIL